MRNLKLLARAGALATVVAVAGASMVGTTTVAPAAPAPESFSGLAKQVSGAVVNISTTQKARQTPGAEEMPFDVPEGSPFEDFFKQFRDQMPRHHGNGGQHEMNMPPAHALGSGFIIDAAGYVVTNNHVIDEASDIQVTVNGAEQYKAKLVGADAKTDLALLKIEGSGSFPAVSLGDSDRVQVGDWVMAVGNPFGLGGTVTAGIISARGRNINAGPFDDFLQTDASINQGNSGGPMFNMAGEVIGVNTAIFSPSGGSVGIGFAVPSNLVKDVVAQLRDKGTVERGWLGVQIQEVTPELASTLGLEKPHGALVAEVQPDSPAAKANVQQGDVIVSLDGKDVAEMRALPRMVAAVPAGKKVDLTVWRDGKEVTVPVSIAKMKDEERVAANVDQNEGEVNGHSSEALGATLVAITPEIRGQYNLEDDVAGVLVVDIDPSGPAAEQGLRVGDVIESAAKKKVKTPADVEAAADKAREEKQAAVLLLVNRQGSSIYVAVKLGQA